MTEDNNWRGIRVRDENGKLLHIIKEHKDEKTQKVTEEDMGETCDDPSVVMDFMTRRFEQMHARFPRYYGEYSKLKTDYKIHLMKDGKIQTS